MTAVYSLVKRPTPVLSVMPQSCNLVYDLLASSADEQGCASLTMAELGRLTRNSRQTIWHALNRLIGARLLEVKQRGVGRAHANTYFIRTFKTGQKKRKSASDKVYMSKKFFSSPESVNPRLYKETQKKHKSKASKDTSAIKSPGHAMYLARSVLQSNANITEDQKQTLLQALGFAIFKRGWFEKIKATPGILHDLLHLLAQRRPPGFPSRGVPARHIFSWLLGLLKSMEEKYRSGVAALVEAIHDGDGSAKCKPALKARVYGTSSIADFLQSMDPDPDVRAAAGSLSRVRRCRRVVRRRPTWSERGLVPSWARKT